MMRTVAASATALTSFAGRGARVLLLLAAGFPFVLLGGFAWFDYDAQRDRAREHVAETVDALAEHAQKVVETADLVLARLLDHLQGRDWASIGPPRETHDFLVSLKQELPQLESVFLVSPDGENVASSRAFPLPPISDSDRPYFIRAKAGDTGLYFSEPFKGQIAGTYAFTITRPRLKDGRFDGLVGVTISPSYFTAFYRAVLGLPRESAAALLRADGALLIRVPEIAGRPTCLTPAASTMDAVRQGGGAGLYVGPSSVDGHARLGGFRRLEGVPLLVVYSMDSALYLHDWYMHILVFGVLAAALTGAILLAGNAMLRQAALERAALQRLVAETARRQEAEASLQQGQKMEALGRLTGGVAHDFNNLLTAILGSLELLQKQVTEPRPRRLIETARLAAQRGAQLTAQMLAFSRKQEVAVRPVDVNAAIRATTDLLRRAIGPAVRVRHHLADDAWHAMADTVQLEIALLNLAVNARDAMPRGGDLTIATDRATIGADRESRGHGGLAPGDYLRVSVTDTGEGMSEEVRARALEPFFTTKGTGEGTGLGLSTVFGFASMMGGTVTIQSAPGAGTTVSLYLPRAAEGAKPQAAAARPQTAYRHAEPARGGASRILLVDDDEAVRTTTRGMLEDLGVEVVEAAGGPEALALVATDRAFDLLVIDFAMPGVNGSECATRIRALWPEARLLFITGYVDNDGLRPWVDLGVPTLGKPFTQEQLGAALTDAIRATPASARVIPFRAAGS
jgi:signal transduction histidine kinase/ActR/RegA family two-component response regulator